MPASNGPPDYPAMKVDELKKLLKQHGLPVSGGKDALVQRLQQAVAAPKGTAGKAKANLETDTVNSGKGKSGKRKVETGDSLGDASPKKAKKEALEALPTEPEGIASAKVQKGNNKKLSNTEGGEADAPAGKAATVTEEAILAGTVCSCPNLHVYINAGRSNTKPEDRATNAAAGRVFQHKQWWREQTRPQHTILLHPAHIVR